MRAYRSGPTAIGWDINCPVNETVDGEGRLTRDDPRSRGFGQQDASPFGKRIVRRARDDPGVRQLREHLRAHNGIRGLELCEPHEVLKAASLNQNSSAAPVLTRWKPGFGHVMGT